MCELNVLIFQVGESSVQGEGNSIFCGTVDIRYKQGNSELAMKTFY